MYLMYYLDKLTGTRVYTLKVGPPPRPPRPAPRGGRRLGGLKGRTRKKNDDENNDEATASPPPLRRPAHPSTATGLRPSSNPERALTVRPQKEAEGDATHSAHPARFSPDDRYSKERVACKKRFNLLPTQRPAPEY